MLAVIDTPLVGSNLHTRNGRLASHLPSSLLLSCSAAQLSVPQLLSCSAAQLSADQLLNCSAAHLGSAAHLCSAAQLLSCSAAQLLSCLAVSCSPLLSYSAAELFTSSLPGASAGTYFALLHNTRRSPRYTRLLLATSLRNLYGLCSPFDLGGR